MKKEKSVKNREKYMKKYFTKFSGRHKDNYDDLLQDDYLHAIDRAHQLLDISKEDYRGIDPILITVPDSFTNKDKVEYRFDKSEDGTTTLLYDQALLTIMFFGEKNLFYYQCNIDHRDGRIAFDIAGEFSYYDVVHMETAIKFDHPDNPKYIILDIELDLTNGTHVPFHLRNHRLHDTYTLPALLSEKERFILDTLKRKIRDSK